MRTNIEIDDELLKQAMQATKTTTKKSAVESALRLTVQLKKQEDALESLRGKVVWRGHDDDWFAPDEEILAARLRRTSQIASLDNPEDPEPGVQLIGESGLH